MEFKAKDRRLEGETTLRQCQLTELYLLDVFVELCEKHGLNYFLDAGTLIGSVRHKGFIPWDDDIDVGMPLTDFNKFIKIASKDLPENTILQKPSYWLGRPENFAKLRDRSSFFCTSSTNVIEPSGIYIDIFPFYKFPSIWPRFLSFLAVSATMARASYDVYVQFYPRRFLQLIHYTLAASAWLFICRSIQTVVRALELFSPCNWRYCIGFGTSRQNGVPYSDLFPLAKGEFEGKKYNIPNNPDAILTKYYGDWRVPPPTKDRVWHANIVCPTNAPTAHWARPYNPNIKSNG